MNIDQVIEKRDRLKPAMNEFKRLELIIRAYELIINEIKQSKEKGVTKKDLKEGVKEFGDLNMNQAQYLLDDLVKKGIADFKPIEPLTNDSKASTVYFYIGGDE